MPAIPAADRPHVLPVYRGEGDPETPVPTFIKCPDCPAFAILTAYIVGYGYDCGNCGMQAPIIA